MSARWMKAGVLLALTAVAVSWASAEMVTMRLGQAPKAGPAAGPDVPRGQPPTAYVPRTKQGPTLDGKLDEGIWEKAATLQLARTLDGGAGAAQPTAVKLLRDDKMLYVGVQAFEPLMSKLQATRRGHDGPVWDDDSIEMFLGTGGVYWHFGVNAVGSTYDGRGKDASWNCGFQAAAGRGKSEYVLEVAIPLIQMAGRAELPTDWIANFNRNRRVTGSLQEAAWSPTYSGDSHLPDRFGRLLLKEPPEPEPGKAPEKPVLRKQDVEILPAANGAGVVRFELSKLPGRARVYRADLLVFRTTQVDGRMDEAMVDIEIYPLFSAFKAGGTARASGKPAAVRGPWYDRFDVTEAVKKWVSGAANGGFFFKACPFWNAEATCLDVWYQGKPQDVPPQVTGVEALHHAGQTFITWKEIADPVGRDEVKWGQLKLILDNLDQAGRTRYCVYRHTRRITAANLHEAELIAAVKPLSCWNVNGRNIDRPVDDYIATADGIMTGHWNPFDVARQDADFGRDCVIDRLVIPGSAAGGRGGVLPSGAGLYVHTSGRASKAHYAVVTCLDGVQNTRDISEANSLAQPVAEQAGEGEPVFQRELPKMPFFNYKQRRLQYVRWVGCPEYANVPSQYYNWSVGVPDQPGEGVPLELNLHRDGHSYWRTHYRIERDSTVLCPHDFPINSWWCGYHEALGTLKSFAQGVIQPYTERRLLAFVDWAAKTWPVGRNRILVTGCRGGASGSGALHLGLRHPEVFNLAISGHGVLDYASASRRTDRGGLSMAMSMQAIWGKPDWDIKTDQGKSFWEAHDMLRLVKAAPVEADLPFLTLTSAWESAHPFYEAMLSAHRGVIADFAWGGARYVAVSAGGTYPNAIHLDVRKDKSYPAIAYVTGMKGLGNNRSLNTEFRWRDVVDKADRYEVTLSGGSEVVVGLRRVQSFRVEPGRSYAWENKLLPGAAVRKPREVKPNTLAAGGQSGEVTVGEDGLLVIQGVETVGAGSRLVVTPK